MELNANSKVKEVEIKKKKYTFAVTTERREFPISADSEAAKQSWMQAINNSIKKLQSGTSTPTGGSGTVVGPSTGTSTGGAGGATGGTKDPEPTKEPTLPAGGAGGVKDPTPAIGATTAANVPKGAGKTPRAVLELAKGTVPWLADKESKVFEFWQIWSESIPPRTELGAGMSIEFHVSISANMQKLNWRTAGPQHIFIQKMVDFFWGVGAPESEIDKLNDIGALINPIRIGSWIDMSSKGGMDGGWYFPVEVPIKSALDAADAGSAISQVKDWLTKHEIEKCYSIGRDMGAAPPRQTEIQIILPGPEGSHQVKLALDAYNTFGFPAMPETALQFLNQASGQIRVSIITSSEGFVRFGILVPKPPLETVVVLSNLAEGNKDGLAVLEGALGAEGPSYVEYQYLMKGFGYSVYKEGFDIVFHYVVGEERA